MRQRIETCMQRALRRELRHIGSIVLTIGPTAIGDSPGYRCRLRIWSHELGVLVVNETGHTVRTTIQHATSRARHAIRRRIHKQYSKYRRIKGSRLNRGLADWALE
jgi:hypothetical protein